jgi:hypothetical protein
MVQGVCSGDVAPYRLLHSSKQPAGAGSSQRSIPTAIYAVVIKDEDGFQDDRGASSHSMSTAAVLTPAARQLATSEGERSCSKSCCKAVEVVAGVVAAVVIIGGAIYLAARIESGAFFPQS